MKPRLFISAVTAELGHTRQIVANVLSRLGYDPVWQDIFGTEPGDLRQVLRDKIDDCDGLIQLVGRGYGAEPPTVDPALGRCSYTQFEFLYAESRGKKTWLIFADDGCTTARPLDQLDLPHDASHTDPVAYQSERRALQDAWRLRWRQEQAHLHHVANNDTELVLRVERLRDDFAELRRQFRSWQQNVTRNLVAALVLLAVVAGGVWWTVFRQPGEVAEKVKEQVEQVSETIKQQLAELEPDRIRQQLLKQIEATHQRQLAEADALADWRKRDEAKRAAADLRDRNLRDVDRVLQQITATIQSGDASPEFLELNRILRDEDVEAALEYVTSQQSRLLDRAAGDMAGAQRELRRTLAPLLQAVRLHRTRGQFAESLELCEKLLLADFNWPEAHHEYFWTLIELGERALRYESLRAAKARFDSAHASAEHLMKLDGNNPLWQRDLSVSYNRLGNVSLQAGQVTEALGHYQKDLEISQKLAAADPTDAQAQRDLFISYSKLGDMSLQAGQVTEALGNYQKGLEISQKQAAADPTDSQAQRDLWVSYEKLGDVSLQAGQVTEALGHYQKALEISQKLAAADPTDAQAQRDLSISYWKLGDVSLQAGQVTEALGHYQKGLEISQKLAAADPMDAQAQRDLWVSYEKLGDVSLQARQVTEAHGYYQKGLEISQKLAAADPTDARAQRDLSISYDRLGDVLRESGQVTEALEQYQKGLEISQKLAAVDPTDARAQSDLLRALASVAVARVQIGDHIEGALEAERLRRLAPKVPGNLYNVACIYSLCAAGIKAKDGELTAEQAVQRQKHIGDALETLREAIKAGWNNFTHMQKDTDLTVLRDLPEFRALIPQGK